MGEVTYIGLAALTAKGRAAVKQAVTEAAEDLVGRAQEATPVDTGTLRASIHVDSVSSFTAIVATGGEASEYAIPQHEGTSRGVPATKYIEGPLIASRPVYLEAMRRAARGEF